MDKRSHFIRKSAPALNARLRSCLALTALAVLLAGCTTVYTVGKVKDAKLVGVAKRNNDSAPWELRIDPAAKASSGNVVLAQDGQAVYKIDYVNDEDGARLVCDTCETQTQELVDATGHFKTSGEARSAVKTRAGQDENLFLFLDAYMLSSTITDSYTVGNMTTTKWQHTYVNTALVTPWANVKYVKERTEHEWIGWTLIYPGAIMALVGGALYAADVDGSGVWFAGGLAITGIAIWQFCEPYSVDEPVYP